VLDSPGLEDDGRREFGAVKRARRHRLRWLAVAHRYLVNGNDPVYRAMKMLISRAKIHLSDILERFNQKSGAKRPLSEDFEAELRGHFRPDVETAERLLGRKIERWER
jgi:hypothetical protein